MSGDIRLVLEEQAPDRTRQIYRDIKRTLDVPFVSDIFAAFGAYPQFLDLVWAGIKPSIGSLAMEGLIERLRAHAYACARQRFFVPDHASALLQNGMDEETVGRLRGMIEMFYAIDPRYLAIAAMVKNSLPEDPDARISAPIPLLPATFAAAGDRSLAGAPGATKRILDEATRTIGLPFVVSELRAAAEWPDYLPVLWSDLNGMVRTSPFRRHVRELGVIAAEGARELPRPFSAAAIKDARISQQQWSEIGKVASAFARSMPVLVLCVSLARLGLNAVRDDELLELEAGA